MYSVEMKNIRREYPGVVANDGVSIAIEPGTVFCLVGENGAGKSTLMKILYGLEKPDSGEIAINGETVSFNSSRDAIKQKIGMVHQHFMLVNELSVLENIILGMEPKKGIQLDYKKAKADLLEISKKFNMQVPLRTAAGQLPVGLQQKVEILKTMYRGADIIILDEPTAVLTPQETRELFATIKELAQLGKTLILITHKLDEVMSIADKIVVMRRGKVVGEFNAEDTNTKELAEHMVGSELPDMLNKERSSDERILKLSSVTLREKGKKPLLFNINLEVNKGEILGIAGVSGNGQSELEDLVAGLVLPSGGSIEFNRKDITRDTRFKRIVSGISYIPEDRNSTGLCGEWSVEENVIAGYHRSRSYGSRGILSKKKMKSFCDAMIEKFDIRTPNGKVQVSALSGGNQQKIVIARESSHRAKLIIAAEPTRGVDIGAISFIHNHIINIKNNGVGILLFSSDLDEIYKLSDRIVVLFEGQIVYTGDSASITKEELGLYMAGAKGGAS